MINNAEFKPIFEELLAAFGKYPSEALFAAFYRAFKDKSVRAFKKTCIWIAKRGDKFPTVKELLDAYRVVAKHSIDPGGDIKSCDWCDRGKIYFARTWSRRAKASGHWDYVGRCAICDKPELSSYEPIDPTQWKSLATRAKEAGGPVVIDSMHYKRKNLIHNGVNPDEKIQNDHLIDLLTDLQKSMELK